MTLKPWRALQGKAWTWSSIIQSRNDTVDDTAFGMSSEIWCCCKERLNIHDGDDDDDDDDDDDGDDQDDDDAKIKVLCRVPMPRLGCSVQGCTLRCRACRCRNKQLHDLKQPSRRISPGSCTLDRPQSERFMDSRHYACSVSCAELNTKVSERHDKRESPIQSFLMKI